MTNQNNNKKPNWLGLSMQGTKIRKKSQGEIPWNQSSDIWRVKKKSRRNIVGIENSQSKESCYLRHCYLPWKTPSVDLAPCHFVCSRAWQSRPSSAIAIKTNEMCV